MPYNERLADRIRIRLESVPKVEEKEMFRGLTFMVDDKMCISVNSEGIMCRIDPAIHDQLLEEQPCRAVFMKGREYKGFIRVNEEDVASNRELNFWIERCLDFNPRANSSKKKKTAAKSTAKKNAVAKKIAAKKTAAKKTVVKKIVTKKSVAKKTAVKNSAIKKTAAKKATKKKTTAKKGK